MKKSLCFSLILSLAAYTAVWAQDRGDRHSGGGGWNNGGGDGSGNNGNNKNDGKGNTRPKNHAGLNNPRNPTNRGNGNPHNGNNAPHQFNRNKGGHPGGGTHNNNFHNGGTRPTNGAHNPHQGTGNNFHSFTGHNTPRGHVSQKFQRMGIRSLPHPMARHNILTADRAHSTMARPHDGPHGEVLHASPIEPRGANAVIVRNHMNTFVNNASFSAQINVYNSHETVANHYYWHNWGGTNYCHYYDSWGYHWYGWYWGGTCFWSRWYLGNWWWYDPVYYRWCYWHDGGWWWQDPAQVNVVYVYNNGQYEPADSTEGASTTAPTGPEQEPEGSAAAVSFASKDGTRMVKIVNGDAFLYDTVQGEDGKPFFLASGVKEVKFSGGNGKPLQVLAIMDDGSFEMYDSDGNAYNTGGGDAADN